MQEPVRPEQDKSEFLDSLKKGLVLGAALLLLTVPPWRMHQAQRSGQPPQAAGQQAGADQPAADAARGDRQAAGGNADDPQGASADAARPDAQRKGGIRLANFRGEQPSRDARLVADWVAFSQDNGKHAFVIVDKKDARVYVFMPDGKLKESAPALMGAAHGDDSFPGIGDKPLAQVRPEEKTTPAGRFIAEPGRNTNNEDIVWVDYDAAVSMHRIRPLVARERRLERLATLTTEDNRISFGCINLPVTFYEDVLSPTVQKLGAVVYVLPEVKTVQEVFGAFDPTDPRQLAAARSAATRGTGSVVQKVSLQAQDR